MESEGPPRDDRCARRVVRPPRVRARRGPVRPGRLAGLGRRCSGSWTRSDPARPAACAGAPTRSSGTTCSIRAAAAQPGAPLTLRSYPGERARLVGIIDIRHGSDYITLSGLDIEGTGEDGANTIKIYSRGVVLEESDITNAWRGRSCLILGNNEGGGQAVATIVRGNTFHECGNPDERQPRPRRLCRERPRWRDRRQPLLQLGRLHDPALPQRAADPVRPQRRRWLRAVGARRHRVRRRRALRLGRQRRRAQRDRVRRDGCDHLLLGGPGRDRQHRARQLRLGVARRRHHSEWGFTAVANRVARPLFASRGARDYRLAPGSQCLRTVGYDTLARRFGALSGRKSFRAPLRIVARRPRVSAHRVRLEFRLRGVRAGTARVVIRRHGRGRVRTLRVRAKRRVLVRPRLRPGSYRAWGQGARHSSDRTARSKRGRFHVS